VNISKAQLSDRRPFVGGCDGRIVMGNDDVALLRLWKDKLDVEE